MIHNEHGNRAEYPETIEYVARAAAGNDLTDQDKVVFLHGTCMTGSPYTYDKDGNVTDVDLAPLIREYQQQDNYKKGRRGDGKYLNHFDLALHPDDTLTNRQWNMALNMFMREMGWDNALYCGFLHLDKAHQHLHVPLHRVQRDGKLIDMHEHYKRAVKACAKISEAFNVRVERNPFEELIGTNNKYTKQISKAKKSNNKKRAKDLSGLEMDRLNIRRRIRQVLSLDPRTIKFFVDKLNEQGVQVKAKEGKPGHVTGVSYSSDGKTWHSGSSISSTHASWGSLLKPKEQGGKGINYNPLRDNKSLGAQSIQRIGIKVSEREVAIIQERKLDLVLRELRHVEARNSSTYIDLAVGCPKHIANLAKLAKIIMGLLDALFGREALLFYTAMQLKRSTIIYQTDRERFYDARDIQLFAKQVQETVAEFRTEDDLHGVGDTLLQDVTQKYQTLNEKEL